MIITLQITKLNLLKKSRLLFLLKDTGLIWMTDYTFSLHQCIVSKAIVEVCETIAWYLGPKLISLPSTDAEMKEKIQN